MVRVVLAVVASGLAVLAGCTLLNSRDGVAGPPLVAPNDGASPDGPAGDGSPPVDAAAVTLYSGLTLPLGLTVDADGGYLYWVSLTTPNRAIFRAPSAGPDAGSIVHMDNVGDPIGEAFDVALDATYLYFGDRGNGIVSRKPLDGGPHETCYSGSTSAAYVTVANGKIFATDFFDAGVGSVVAGTCAAGAQAIYTGQPRASGVAATAQSVYWGRAPGEVAVGDVASIGSSSAVAATNGVVGGVAFDPMSRSLYWIEGNQRVVRFVNATQTKSTLYEASETFGDCDIAVDDQWVYWTESAHGVIKRIAK